VANEGLSRWYLDGYRARMKRTPRENNPRHRYRGKPNSVKAVRWDQGWQAADDHLQPVIKWDQEQDIIDALQEEATSYT